MLLLDACATLVGGRIPPSAFEFHEILSQDRTELGGWRVAQVNILLARASKRRPLHAWCDVEIGVPAANWERAISDSFAQSKSAEAADEAARIVLRMNVATSAAACERFRQEMWRILREYIKGARVTKFITPDIEPRNFPED